MKVLERMHGRRIQVARTFEIAGLNEELYVAPGRGHIEAAPTSNPGEFSTIVLITDRGHI